MIELIIILRKAILDNWLIAFFIGLHDAILIDKLCTLVVSRDIARYLFQSRLFVREVLIGVWSKRKE